MDAEQHSDPAPAIRPWVVIPTYDNARTVEAVVRGARGQCERVLVVDDGSRDGTAAVLDELEGVVVLRHASNRGKGAALATGFAGVCIHGTTKFGKGTLNEPITIGQVTIQPGDIVVGDRDGVVIVPKGKTAEAIEKARAREQKEARVMERLRNGETTLEIYGW
jgi:regulator of RNase E activity RraA